MGRQAPRFVHAQRDPSSEAGRWFVMGPQHKGGARTWKDVQNLPELKKRVLTEEPSPFVATHISADLKALCLTLLMRGGFSLCYHLIFRRR